MDRPFYLALLAEAQALAGRPEEALETLAEAAEAAPEGREFFYEAEFHRLRGRLCLRTARPDEVAAEEGFRRALAVARRQEARSLELRAALDLAELHGGGDGGAEARHLVDGLYHGFDEGLETADLVRARRLLAEGATPA